MSCNSKSTESTPFAFLYATTTSTRCALRLHPLQLGYWIIEDLVDRKNEHFPRGGLSYLIQGLSWLSSAGISVVLDHHALPGAQATMQEFTGICTRDPQFYQDKNYRRALTWSAVMTALSHVHPAFGSVFALEAVNEPLMDANTTPGYGDCT